MKYIGRVAALVLVLLLIAYLGVFAYRSGYNKGKAEEKRKAAQFAEELFVADNIDALQKGIRVLKVVEKHPECFEKQEIRYWITRTEGWMKDVDRMCIPFLQKQHADDRVNTQTEKVREAGAILARLKKKPDNH